MNTFDFILVLLYFFMSADDDASSDMSGGGLNQDGNNFETHIQDASLDSEDGYGQNMEQYKVAANVLDNQKELIRDLDQFEKQGFWLNPDPGISPDTMIGFQNETKIGLQIGLWRVCKTSTSISKPNGGNTVLGAPYYKADLGPGRTSDAVILHPDLQVRVEACWPTQQKNARSVVKGSSLSEVQDLPMGKGRLTLATEGNAVVLKFDSQTTVADDRIIIDVPEHGLAPEGIYSVYILQKNEVVAGPFRMDSTSRRFAFQFEQKYIASILQEHSTGKLYVGSKCVEVIGGDFIVAEYQRGSRITRELGVFSIRDYNQQE